MLAITKSVALTGMEGRLVMVEVDVSNGLPAFNIVGLPDNAVREAAERVRTAIRNSGFEFPMKRITVNLAPADIRKEGPVYDLAIAVGILAASGQLPLDNIGSYVFLGELSLDGSIKYVQGVLPSVIIVKTAGENKVVLPVENGPEGSLVKDVMVFCLSNLQEAAELVSGLKKFNPLNPYQPVLESESAAEDLCDVRGQQIAKRALTIAAAGGHNLLMVGPPGSGKTMLARRLPLLMPGLSWQESIEVTKIYSIAGLLKPAEPLITRRPFRAPHHNVSRQSLVGGGRIPKPGEISLSNHGVLFLDELPEFSKDSLEALRQPIEERSVTISRVQGAFTYPANIILVAAMNPCPCGFYGSNLKECHCTPGEIKRYLHKISGPLLDRIDMHVEVPALDYRELAAPVKETTTAEVREVVDRARKIQRKRLGPLKCNAEMRAGEIKDYCRLSKGAVLLMKEAFQRLGLSARAHHRILKIARTIADLAIAETIDEAHIGEAIQYRSLDRKYWA